MISPVRALKNFNLRKKFIVLFLAIFLIPFGILTFFSLSKRFMTMACWNCPSAKEVTFSLKSWMGEEGRGTSFLLSIPLYREEPWRK